MTYPPVTTNATMSFATRPPNGERAIHSYVVDPLTGERPRNFGLEDKSVVIENVRGKEDSVSLDTTGFQFYKDPITPITFDDDEEIRRVYFPESIALIKKYTGASRVEIFEHTVRRRIPGQSDVDGLRQPLSRVHVDQTAATAITLVHKFLPPADVPKLLERRFQIINLWRPIEYPAVDWPLTLCDYRSVDVEKDTFSVSRISADNTSEREFMAVQYGEGQKWKYLHGMTPEEFVLFKCAESIQDGSVAVFVPHTGFSDPTTPEGTPYRQSIELRTLVFYD